MRIPYQNVFQISSVFFFPAKLESMNLYNEIPCRWNPSLNMKFLCLTHIPKKQFHVIVNWFCAWRKARIFYLWCHHDTTFQILEYFRFLAGDVLPVVHTHARFGWRSSHLLKPIPTLSLQPLQAGALGFMAQWHGLACASFSEPVRMIRMGLPSKAREQDEGIMGSTSF